MPLPLNKVKVLDFTHLLPGEFCSTILTDLGCQVTRVESLRPGLAQKLPPQVKGESLYYWSLHRNQRRIALDLKDPRGVEIVHKLAQQADVVLENFRPGVMSRLGVGYRQLRRVNKSLVFCSVTGYGQTSAWGQRPGHDLNFVAEAGLLSLNRRPGEAPVLPGVLVSDYTAAIYAALAVVAALFEREHTGKGKHIDISMFECALSTVSILATLLLYTGRPAEEAGFTYRASLPNYNIYQCADGRFLVVAALERHFWETFCEKIGQSGLPYPVGPDPALNARISAVILGRTLAQWLEIFDGSDCCVSPVHNLDEALAYLPSQERGVITHLAHPVLGKVPQLATPVLQRGQGVHMSTATTDPARETVRVLKKLGYSSTDIQSLSADSVIPSLP